MEGTRIARSDEINQGGEGKERKKRTKKVEKGDEKKIAHHQEVPW